MGQISNETAKELDTRGIVISAMLRGMRLLLTGTADHAGHGSGSKEI